ncbi:MAG TPA: hypothetical protein VM711_04025, partial [Sphingomicrobium sp.]|nr:hypothetical protein [Sphingomicrobium sp.]
IFGVKYKTGYDLDLIGGYDLGSFRLEGEIGYKRARLDRVSASDATLAAISNFAGVGITNDDLRLNGHARVLSGMVNGLVDFGGNGSFGGYLGGGVGLANVKFAGGGVSANDSKFAWQALAGLYAPVSQNVDIGLKYRYFRTGKLKFSDSADFGNGPITAQLSGRFSSHSLLASATYNFGASAADPQQPAYVPPPPPPAPAVQTCADGSEVPATSACPYAPPPPPPPPVRSRGERG